MKEKVWDKFKEVKQKFSFLPRAVLLVWRAAAGWTLIWALLLLVQGFFPALIILLTRTLVDQLSALLRSAPGTTVNWLELAPTFSTAMLMGGLMLVQQMLSSLAGYVSAAQSERVALAISSQVHQKAANLDYQFFDQSENYNRLHRAQYDASYRPLTVVNNLGSLLQSSVTLITMAAILLPYGVWLPILLAITSLPALWVILRYQRKQLEMEKRTTQDQRRNLYYELTLTARISAAELRMFGLAGHFQQRFKTVRRFLMEERLKLQRQQLASQMAVKAFALAVAGLCMGFMVWRGLNGQATLGDLALFYQSFNQGQSLIQGLLGSAGQLYGSLAFLGNLFEFLDLKMTLEQPLEPQAMPEAEPVVLQFQGVSFAYPGSNRQVLEDFNLVIPAGKMTAIVGDNGAGKSTLLKLLCRLYDPQAGRVTWNGVDLRSLSQEDLHRKITVMFQEPFHYQESAHNNILYSRLDSAQPEDVVEAAREAGADEFINRLAHGYQTVLGNLFDDGTELSTGQWQRIALARAFLRRAPLMLLDEPTSAMDAWAEAEWLSRLRTLIAGKTTLVITHRLTTAMQADIIYVMVDGKIIEVGTHSELMVLDGRYATAWKAQTNQKNNT